MTSAMTRHTVHIRGLLRSLDALDHSPLPRKVWERSAEARDEARMLAAVIRDTVPSLDELASACAVYFMEDRPDLLKEDRSISYWGPDVFRAQEGSYLYPDDSGQDPEDANYKSWAELNGLGAEERAFEDRVRLRVLELQASHRANKKRATAEKRTTTRKRTALFKDMLEPASGLYH
ncbi:MAG: hypothetical protein ACOH2N_11315 [Devosia sp.]